MKLDKTSASSFGTPLVLAHVLRAHGTPEPASSSAQATHKLCRFKMPLSVGTKMDGSRWRSASISFGSQFAAIVPGPKGSSLLCRSSAQLVHVMRRQPGSSVGEKFPSAISQQHVQL